MLINKIIFQRIEISLHMSIIIRISSFTHALSNTKLFTEFCMLFRSVLTALVGMHHKLAQIYSWL